MHDILRYALKCRQVGLSQAVRAVKARFTQRAFDALWRTKALQNKANHTWHAALAPYAGESFSLFFEHICTRFKTFPVDSVQFHYEDFYTLQEAEKARQNIFDVLGSGPLKMQNIVWHHDIRLQAQAPEADFVFDADTYYKDIVLTSDMSQQLGKDIKVPWEISRFQRFLFLGKAYQLTRDERYTAAFIEQSIHWIDANPFLLGINWVCPMEVALRAVNWIWGFYFFKDAPISEQFWQKFVCSLYDHYVYLENTWEFYDGRTSNHYLSDLIGYFYLCYFFSDLSGVRGKADYCFKRILAEMKRQVFPEGTSYEGSTNYHRFVTELFFHASLIMNQFHYAIPSWFIERLNDMCLFIEACSLRSGFFVSIGDHDSSTVLCGGLSHKVIERSTKSSREFIKQYRQFGVSIIKINDWHITLRHHAYRKRQPSGHFHNDVGSITVSYKETPIIIDPGSFVYTASASWRNYFRAARMHNSFSLQNCEPVHLDDNLFFLDIPEKNNTNDTMHMVHTLYKNQGLTAHRQVVYDGTHGVSITDWWEGEKYHGIPTVWNFIFSPSLNLVQDNNAWLIYSKDQLLLRFISDSVLFAQEKEWVSLQYGKKEACWALRAQHAIKTHEKIVFFLLSD